MVTDNMANIFFKTQKKLSARQACWQEFLVKCNFEWLSHPSRHNIMTDALSLKEVVAYIMTLSRGSNMLHDLMSGMRN